MRTDNNPEINVSVRTIVEMFHREGDIVPGRPDPAAFAEGGVVHRELQGSRGEGYRSEVTLSCRVEGRACVLVVSGRADGVIEDPDGVTVEEIKSTLTAPADIAEDGCPAHWTQACLYGAMLAAGREIDSVTVRLVYVHRVTRETTEFSRRYATADLAALWSEATGIYLEMMDRLTIHRGIRNASLDTLEFPFSSFRTGQKEMAERVYRTVRDSGVLYLEAPTGIGKTMAVLYPAAKALGNGHTSRVFYLVAKTATKTVAEEAMQRLVAAGASMKSVTLTAKGKICFMLEEGTAERPPCDPAICPFARGHYGRVDAALSDVFEEAVVTRDIVERYARTHTVCPFEFSLDISNWVDVVIGDYNYAFDPRVKLQRFFRRGNTDYTILVDEAHNLVDRGRAMYSAALNKRATLAARRAAKNTHPKLVATLSQLNSLFLGHAKTLRDEMNNEERSILEPGGALPGTDAFWVAKPAAPDHLDTPLRKFLRECEIAMRSVPPVPSPVLDYYFEVLAFVTVMANFSDAYMTLYRVKRSGLSIDLSCVDPSSLIAGTVGASRAGVFFSATLEPLSYFSSLLTGRLPSDSVAFDSPFHRENLCLIVDPTIATRYQKRDGSYDRIAQRIRTVANGRRGNYLVFFPSYAYAEKVRFRIESITDQGEMEIVHQRPGMTEPERDDFLGQFRSDPTRTLVGIVVMGGVFAEGIDLRGDRLTGAIVVGPGLPQIGPDRDVIRHYFDNRSPDGHSNGFDYAYTYPGFNRVEQAAGRVIRTDTDRGVVLLIDERFAYTRYRDLFPAAWCNPMVLDDQSDLASELGRFWGDE